VQHHAVLASTMDAARARARRAPDGTVVVARRQTRGCGRHGRDWFSPQGNLYASILLRPGLPPARLTELGFIVAHAAADAVDAVLQGGRARLKWPNDVLVGGVKVAGIMVEIIEDNAAVIGIGLNIAQAPEATSYPVTCLCDGGAGAARGALDAVGDGPAPWSWSSSGFVVAVAIQTDTGSFAARQDPPQRAQGTQRKEWNAHRANRYGLPSLRALRSPRWILLAEERAPQAHHQSARTVPPPYRPTNTGGRFSMNARRPSL